MTPWTTDPQASVSLGFFKQEYWSGLPSLEVSVNPSTLSFFKVVLDVLGLFLDKLEIPREHFMQKWV